MKQSTFNFGFVLTMGLLVPAYAHASIPAAVPEPVSMLLLAIGVGGIGAAALIRQRKGSK
jgi:hypothetical protein